MTALMVFIVLSYPFSYAFTYINGKNNRHIFGITFGLIFQYIVYRENILIWWMV